MSNRLTASQFIRELKAMRPATPRSSADLSDGMDQFMDVPMGRVFALAKVHMHMPNTEIERLLESPIHEVRAGAVAIMDFQARSKKTPPAQRKALFDLYIRRHDRINDWDLVDRSAPYVLGGYLHDKSRSVLYRLARSKSQWERRSAIVATYFFIRQDDLDDTFKIAEILVHDKADLVQKAVGGWVREAGKRDPRRLLAFLDKYAATMPRTMLRYAIEHLPASKRKHYLGLKGRSD